MGGSFPLDGVGNNMVSNPCCQRGRHVYVGKCPLALANRPAPVVCVTASHSNATAEA